MSTIMSAIMAELNALLLPALVDMHPTLKDRFRWRVLVMAVLVAVLAAVLLSSASILLPTLGQSQQIGSGPPLVPSPPRLDYYRDPAQAPPSWLQFAKLVKYRFDTWISADDAVANRFRDYVISHAGKDDGPPETLAVRAWLNPDGTVERVSFPPLSDTQADADLHTILKRGNIGEAPPPEMLQPLRFSLNLKK